MRALVTGGSGFVGSHIAFACLGQGDEVRALVRPSSDLAYLKSLSAVALAVGELESMDAALRATQGIDVVYHSAARVLDYGTRKQFFDANVLGTRVLLEAAQKNGVRRFVFVSSPSVVADDTDQHDIDESYPYPKTFLNLYSETKAISEQLVLAANRSGFTTCAIRPRGVWGPRDRTGYMPKMIAKLIDGKLPDLSGGKKVYASLCHATNAAHACLLAARSDRVGGNAYFVTDGEKTDVWAYAEQVGKIFDAPPITRKVSARKLAIAVSLVELLWKIPYLAHRYSPPVSRYGMSLLTRSGTFDTRAAQRDFGYSPKIDGKTAFAELRAWIDTIGGVSEYLRYVR